MSATDRWATQLLAIERLARTILVATRAAGGTITVASLRRCFGGWKPTNGEVEAAIHLLAHRGYATYTCRPHCSAWFSSTTITAE